MEHRTQVYQLAKSKNPIRWSGETRNWDVVEEVYLNPVKQKTKIEEKRQHNFITLGDNYIEKHRQWVYAAINR